MNRKNYSNTFRKLYVVIVILISIALLSACIFFLLSDYDILIRRIVKTTQKPYLEATLRNNIFTTSKFALLRKLCILLLLIVPLAGFLLILYRIRILYFSRFVYQSIRQNLSAVRHIFLQNSRRQNISILMILMLVTARSLYYIVSFDLQYDEMWSYNYFTAQPFYYPLVVSSNYPLYEVSTQLFKWLPFNMKINIRLPVLIAGILSCIVLYACLKKYFSNHIVALGGMTLFAFMPVTTFYMLYARGVMFSLFFSIVAIFSLLSWLQHKERHQYLVVFAIANAAGFYSMPTYLYLWGLLFLFSLLFCVAKLRSHIKYILIANAGGGAIAALLYLPVIAGSGLSFLLDASVNDKPFSLAQLWQYSLGVSDFFTGLAYGLAVIFILSILAFAINKKLHAYRFRFLTALCIALCLVPILICLLQHVQVPPRAIAFTGLAIPVLFSLLLSVVAGSRYNIAMIACIVCAASAAAFISHRHSFLNWSINSDRQAKELSGLFLQHHITTCYDNSAGSDFFYNYPALEYYYRMNDQPFVLFTSMNNSLRYKPFSPGDEYDCIAYHLTDSITNNHYYKGYENRKEGFVLYIRKGR